MRYGPLVKSVMAKESMVVFFAFFSAIVVSGSFYISHQLKTFRQTKQFELTAIADLKAAQISNWYGERMADARIIFKTSLIQRQAVELLDGSTDVQSRHELLAWMENVRNEYGYEFMALYGADGVARSTAPSDHPAPHMAGDKDFLAALHAGDVRAGDLHRDKGPGEQGIHFDIMIPIGASPGTGSPVKGVWLLRIDPYRFLYPLVQSWPTPSDTAETLLVRQEGNDVLFLNELRHRSHSALILRRPMDQYAGLAATQAIRGREGIVERLDYRGVPTLAAMRRVAGTPWFMVAKMDTDEIYAPLRRSSRMTLFLLFVLTVTAALGISLRERRREERALQEANEQLEKRVVKRTASLSEVNDRLSKEIADRKAAQEQLQEQHLFLSSIITDAGEGLCVCHACADEPFVEFSLWNGRMRAITGYSMEEINRGGWYQTLCRDPARQLRVREQMERVWQGENLRAESWELNCADGEERAVLVTTSTVGTYRGSVHTLVLINDVTAQKRLEAQLLAAKKMEAIGQLAGGVAHEVRNPLNAILSITEALFQEREIGENPDFEPYIQHIRTQVRRLARLMNDLLDLGKPIPSANLQAVPLYRFCRETAGLWKASGTAGGRQVVIECTGQAEGLSVLADSVRLEQVIFNLLENAAQHSPDASDITVHLLDSVHPESAGQALVRIADSGRGVPPGQISRVFEPFFTGRKGGTGLGLTLARHFVESMGGSVELWNNDPPPGCSAVLRIPMAGKETA